MKLLLRPAKSDSRTRLRLSGALPTGLPRSAMHQILAPLAYWSGQPLEVVLCAADPADWLDCWYVALEEIPDHLVRMRFVEVDLRDQLTR